ncbi:hypothetical protein EON65_05935 [archaeon]|nr:MAG: hypothetical protein EON65_05935 [archaeon]
MLAFQDHFTSRSSSFRWADSWEREVIQPQHNDRRPSTSPASFPAAPVRVSSSRPSSIRSPTTLPPSPWTLESSVPSIQYIFTSYPSALPSPAVTSRSPTRVPYLAPSAAPSEIPTAQPSTYQPSSSSDPSSAPTLVPTASTRPSTSLPSYLPSLVPTEYVTWQPSPLPSFAPTTKSSTSTAPSKELPFSRSLSFYSSNFTETPPDLSSLDFLIESTLLLHYSSDELNVTWVSSKLNAVQPSVRGVSPLVEQELDLRQYVVNSTIFYKMLYADSDAQLTSSLATQQLQQSLRTVAGSQQQAEYEYMVVCSEDSIQDCLYNATVSGDSNREGWTFCDKDAQDWQELYNNPSSCPFSLFWYFSLLIVYCWMLLKAFYEMCFAAKLHTYLHVSSTLASINCCVLRGLYFAYILSAVLNDDTFDRVACTELNFLEEDFDPTYALLQALVYLALLCAGTSCV